MKYLVIILKNGIKKIIPILDYLVHEDDIDDKNFITYTKINNVETTIFYNDINFWQVVSEA